MLICEDPLFEHESKEQRRQLEPLDEVFIAASCCTGCDSRIWLGSWLDREPDLVVIRKSVLQVGVPELIDDTGLSQDLPG